MTLTSRCNAHSGIDCQFAPFAVPAPVWRKWSMNSHALVVSGRRPLRKLLRHGAQYAARRSAAPGQRGRPTGPGGQSRGAEPGAETAARDLRRTNVPRSIIALAPTLGRFGAVGSAAPDGQHRSDEGHRERHVVMRDEHHERDHLHLQVQARLRTDDRRSAGARRRSRGGLTYQRLQTAEDMDAGIPAGQHLRHQRIDLRLKLRELRRRHV